MLVFSMITNVFLIVFYSCGCGLHYSAIYSCFSLCDCPYGEKNSVFIPLSRFFLGFLIFLFQFFFNSLKKFPPALNFFSPALHFLPHRLYPAFNSPPPPGKRDMSSTRYALPSMLKEGPIGFTKHVKGRLPPSLRPPPIRMVGPVTVNVFKKCERRRRDRFWCF